MCISSVQFSRSAVSDSLWPNELHIYMCVCVCVCVCIREREKKRGRERSQKLNKVRARREFNLPSPSIIRLPRPSQGIRHTKATQSRQKLNLASKTPSPGPQLPVGSAHLDLPGWTQLEGSWSRRNHTNTVSQAGMTEDVKTCTVGKWRVRYDLWEGRTCDKIWNG